MLNTFNRLTVSALVAVAAAAGCSVREPQKGELSITSVEVTQGIQVSGNQIPLLAYKRTFVRIYVKSGDDPAAGVKSTLSIRAVGPGMDKTKAAQLTSGTITVSPKGSDHRTLIDSFLFEVPSDLLGPGIWRLHAGLVLPAGREQAVRPSGPDVLVYDTDITLRTLYAPTVGPPCWQISQTACSQPRSGDKPIPIEVTAYVVSYGLTDIPRNVQTAEGFSGSTVQPRDWRVLNTNVAYTENLLPVFKVNLKELAWQTSTDDHSNMLPCGYDADAPNTCDAGLRQARIWAENLIDKKFGHGGNLVILLQPERGNCECGEEHGTVAGNQRVNLRLLGPTSHTLAHELAHTFGVGHTPEVAQSPDPAYPRRDGSLGDYVGLQYAPGPPAALPGAGDRGPSYLWDIMSYAQQPRWISPYTYCKALDGATHGVILCPEGVDGYHHAAT